jgi:hypothetical protein
MLNYNQSKDGFGGRFEGGHREYAVSRTLGTFDCDDQCDNRYPTANEECDQIDNDCSLDEVTGGGEDGGIDDVTPGIPDSLDAAVVLPGTISVAELDLDEDNFLSCADLPSITTQSQYSSVNCDSGVVVDTEAEDCMIFCSLANPNGVGSDGERCDGLTNVCGIEDDLEGSSDLDRDNYRECGAYGTDGNGLVNEDIYVAVWMKDVNWSARGSEEVQLTRSVREEVEGSLSPAVPLAGPELPGDVAGDSAVVFDTAADTAAAPPPPDDTGLSADTGDTGSVGDDEPMAEDVVEYDDSSTNGTLEDFIPLILPRVDANFKPIACDEKLYNQLASLIGEDVLMDALRNGNKSEGQRADVSELLTDICTKDYGSCTIVRASYSAAADERTYDDYIVQPGALSAECGDHPEQWISRAVWQHDRILEARRTVIELECQRLFGESCSELDVSSPLVSDWKSSRSDFTVDRYLDSVDTWWKELDRYEVEPALSETFLTCWGDPRDPTDSITDQTGGDCDDSSETGAQAHRDLPEGPDDLLGLYLDMAVSCSTCLDGIDNNCDGNVDCADPACARCFIGQGVGCSRGDTPCAQSGCSNGTPQGGALIDRFFAAAVLALFAVLYRRRETR